MGVIKELFLSRVIELPKDAMVRVKMDVVMRKECLDDLATRLQREMDDGLSGKVNFLTAWRNKEG